MKWPLANIGDYTTKVENWNPASSADQHLFSYIDLSSVDKEKKEIDLQQISEILTSEAPSRARQLVQAGDILVATVRPNLNGVAVVPDILDGATASTGYCVLRPDETRLHGRYLFHWTKSQQFINDMMSKAIGANYPAVSDRIVKESKFPLPPLEEQNRIAAILDKADVIRRKRQQAIQLADDFLRSVFLDMFGDPVINPKRWEKASLEYYCEINPNAETLENDLNISFVPMQNISETSHIMDTSEIRNYSEVKKGYTAFKENDIVFAKITPCMENGKSGIATGLKNGFGFGSTEFHILRPKKPYYAPFLYTIIILHGFRKQAASSFTGAVGHKRVPASFLKNFTTYKATDENIKKYYEIFYAIEKTKQVFLAKLADSSALFESISKQSFF